MCRRRVGRAECLGTLMTMVDEPTEIFDDLYLGLRAGGAMRKRRRGEPLTMEEEEALGRWESLSGARKAATIGAFALGTFGLRLYPRRSRVRALAQSLIKFPCPFRRR